MIADTAAPAVDPELLEPFWFPGSRRPPCLLIHGFTGTPYEMRGLGEHLHRHGHAVLGVRLAGHGGTLADLERSRWEDWYATVADGCSRLLADGGPVAAIGLSVGAVLSLHLASERPLDVSGLVLMAPAIALGRRARWLIPLVARLPWVRTRFRFIPKAAGSDISDTAARRGHPSHRAVPLAGAMSLLELQRVVRAECGAIGHPSLLIHGALDHTCPPSNASLLARSLGVAPRRVLILPQSAHVVTVDRELETVRTAVAEFVAGLA